MFLLYKQFNNFYQIACKKYLTFLFEVSWNVAKRICVSEGIKAANIPRNGFNGTTARLAEVNSQHKNDQLKANAELGNSYT